MTAGRKPSAEHLKLIRREGEPVGEAGEKNSDNARRPAKAAELTAPSHLTAAGKREYLRIAGLLLGMNKWSELFRQPLAVYARAYTDLVEAENELAASGKLVRSPKGYPIQNPWLAIRNRANETMLKVAAEMGLTLTSHVRVADAQLELFDTGAGQKASAGDDGGHFAKL